MDEVDGM